MSGTVWWGTGVGVGGGRSEGRRGSEGGRCERHPHPSHGGKEGGKEGGEKQAGTGSITSIWSTLGVDKEI